MNRIGFVKLCIETLFVALWVNVFPMELEIKLKLIGLYGFIQIMSGRYQGNSLLFYDEMKLLLLSFIGYLFISLMILPYQLFNFKIVLIYFVFCVVTTVFAAISSRYIHILFRNYFKKNVLIIGIGHTAQALFNICVTNRFSLMDCRCFISCNGSEYLKQDQENIVEGLPIYNVDSIEQAIKENKIDTVLVAIPQMNKKNIKKLMTRFQNDVKVIKYLPQVPDTINFDSHIDDFDGLLMISTATGVIHLPSKIMKRFLDIMASLAGLLLLLPITIFVYFKNRREGDTDPIFFTQERIGKDGKIFKLYKFRTMVPNAEQVLEELMEKDPAIKEEYLTNKKLVNDPRITKAGAFLRKTSLDEFPQFINVLKGEMSLIGRKDIMGGTREKNSVYAISVI